MTITDYQAAYLAHELTKRVGADNIDRFASTVASAQVDLNPHQVDAALFAFNSPFSRGALLADEVGLGKTIEAGLVIAQKWAQRQRRILVIAPANLRKQWHQELEDKFFMPCRLLESNSYNELKRHGSQQPFSADDVVLIVSYQFANAKRTDITEIPWDLVVLDEAHRLRNVYKPTNIIANNLKTALRGRPKLLLTATPLQNSLLEIFGLVSIVDEHTFGDLKSFREQFGTSGTELSMELLRRRLVPVCHRTLRRQVTAYVPYTRRHPLVEEFSPDADEERLYALVSEYLRRPRLFALPGGQRALMTLVLRKLLASSTFAIAGALSTMAARLRGKLNASTDAEDAPPELGADYETLAETAEEWSESADSSATDGDASSMRAEIEDLESFAQLARTIDDNAKGRALLRALSVAMQKTAELGAPQKAIVFTESRKTQDYLMRVLGESPWSTGVVMFNGSNTDAKSLALLSSWTTNNRGTDRVTGVRAADMRSALVDYFRDEGQIMISTEAGAEGINLQFCALVVNYDLPWNPQRIEQRIGRCHRYGQRHDVVVVNFVNRTNAADQRVLTLLSEKFRLFDGVFGASDEVLGAIESGVDFEQRVNDIYQSCRTSQEIDAAFTRLQEELSDQISATMSSTRQKLLENFDDEVREKLRVRDQTSRDALDRYETDLMALTAHELGERATFLDRSTFQLSESPFPGISAAGTYELPRRNGTGHTYRLGHPLAEAVIASAKARDLSRAQLTFGYTGYEGKITVLQPLLGVAGRLSVSLLTIETPDRAEDHLLFAAFTDSNESLDDDIVRRLLSVPATALPCNPFEVDDLIAHTHRRASEVQHRVAARDLVFFEAEVEKLDRWAEDLKLSQERELKEVDRQIRQARRASSLAASLDDKLTKQRHVRALDAQRSERRRTLFEAHDEVDRRHEEMIDSVQLRLVQQVTHKNLFTVRWRVE